MIIILLLLLLPLQAGAQFEERIQYALDHRREGWQVEPARYDRLSSLVAVMSRQQATMPAIPAQYSMEYKVFALQARVDSLEVRLSRLEKLHRPVPVSRKMLEVRLDSLSFDPEGK